MEFGDKFNQPINNLPNSITNLTFGRDFNQEINIYPINLTHLTISNEVKHLIKNIPSQVKIKYLED